MRPPAKGWKRWRVFPRAKASDICSPECGAALSGGASLSEEPDVSSGSRQGLAFEGLLVATQDLVAAIGCGIDGFLNGLLAGEGSFQLRAGFRADRGEIPETNAAAQRSDVGSGERLDGDFAATTLRVVVEAFGLE